jgi:hypothetical protein
MDYNVIIIAEADLLNDPVFVHRFKANGFNDFRDAVGEAIVEWRRLNPRRDFLKARCTVLVEQAVFTGSTQAFEDKLLELGS